MHPISAGCFSKKSLLAEETILQGETRRIQERKIHQGLLLVHFQHVISDLSTISHLTSEKLITNALLSSIKFLIFCYQSFIFFNQILYFLRSNSVFLAIKFFIFCDQILYFWESNFVFRMVGGICDHFLFLVCRILFCCDNFEKVSAISFFFPVVS